MHHPNNMPASPYPAAADLVRGRTIRRLTRQMLGGANWFFWIAGLSMLNSILGLLRIDPGFTLGLWATQFFDAWGTEVGGPILAVAAEAIAAGLLLAVGVLAREGRSGAFIAGLGLYLLDTLLLMGQAASALRGGATADELQAMALGAAIHLYALYRMFQGWQAGQTIEMLTQAARNDPPPGEQLTPPPPPSGPTYIVRH